QSSVEPGCPPAQRRLARALPPSHCPVGEFRGHRPFSRHLLPGGELGLCGALGGPGHQVAARTARRRAQGAVGLSAGPGLPPEAAARAMTTVLPMEWVTMTEADR